GQKRLAVDLVADRPVAGDDIFGAQHDAFGKMPADDLGEFGALHRIELSARRKSLSPQPRLLGFDIGGLSGSLRRHCFLACAGQSVSRKSVKRFSGSETQKSKTKGAA